MPSDVPSQPHNKVFISYTHDSDEHKRHVLRLADSLRAYGVDCRIDQFEAALAEGDGAGWMAQQIRRADFVLLVCTREYLDAWHDEAPLNRRRGARWEILHIRNAVYRTSSRNNKFVPVVLREEDTDYIPDMLATASYYFVNDQPGFESLYRRLTGQPFTAAPPLGEIRALSAGERLQIFGPPGVPPTHPQSEEPRALPMSVTRSSTDDEVRAAALARIRLLQDEIEAVHRKLGFPAPSFPRDGSTTQTIGDITGSTVVQAAANATVNIQMVMREAHGRIDDAEAGSLAEYLRVSMAEWRHIPLAGIDPEQSDATGRSGQPELDHVYIELNLREPRPEPEEERDVLTVKRRKKASSSRVELRPERDQSPWTAMEACNVHQRLVILGDPGSGKSTFLRMLAIQLGERLMNRDASGHGAKSESATEGDSSPLGKPLVPIFVTLRDFASAGLDGRPDVRLIDFIQQELRDSRLAAAAPVIERMIQDGRAVLMLDGLDEIAGSGHREAVLEAVTGFTDRFSSARVLITCRVAAYTRYDEGEESAQAVRRSPLELKHADWRLPREVFPVVTLAPFDTTQMRRFISVWYRELRRKNRKLDPVLKTESLRRALDRPHIRRMAGNPLLLTVMTIVHATMGELPDQRVLLYAEAVETLLRRWRQGREPGAAPDAPETVEALLSEVGRTPDALEPRLSKLAWEVHASSPDGDDAVASISIGTLIESLRSLHPAGDLEWVGKFVEAIKHRSGLLIERRGDVFTFPHRTFQEYLAARHLARNPDWVNIAFDLRGRTNAIWREVILMVGGTFAHVQNDPLKVSPLLARLLEAGEASGDDDTPISALLLASDLVCEVTPAKLKDDETSAALLEELRSRLQQGMLDTSRALKDRSNFGTALGRVGDLRDGVMPVPGSAFPDIAWSLGIEPQAFPMGNSGTEAKYAQEKPRFTCGLIKQSYAVSLYPITVGQYRLFVQAGGYTTEGDRHWTAAGLAWRDAEGIDGPATYDEVFQTQNHPQVGVSWYEATAFCRWLAEASGLPIRLPTEPEWERAARHTDARVYPWAAEQDEKKAVARANVWEGKLRHTTPVGLFADSAAKCGALDMAGNVWEWCGSKWTYNYEGYEKAHDSSDVGDDPRVLRGGSWSFIQEHARCADRSWNHPNGRVNLIGFRVCVSPFSSSEL